MSGVRVAVSGVGAISALGLDSVSFARHLRAGTSAVKTGGKLARWGLEQYPSADVAGELRTDQLAVCAAREAIDMAKLGARERQQLAVVVGTTTGGIASSESWLLDGAPASVLECHRLCAVADQVAHAVGAGGLRLTTANACAASASAIARGVDLLAGGVADAVLVGGADALCRVTSWGFASLRLLSDTVCRPFHQRRSGLNLGEGAAFLLLEPAARAKRRAVRPLAWLLGCGESCDGYHRTAPAPDAQLAQRAVVQALQRAGVSASQIGYVNAHGTGTQQNDAAEATLLSAIFAGRCPAVSSIKPAIGHTLGAAGALEAVASVLGLRDQFLPWVSLPPLVGDRPLDDAIGWIGRVTERPVEFALSLSFAFGGSNAALVFGRADAF
ncbi:MAG: beta-ketoacyl-[acyl-carrier-protein] synthase family protein [Deltaproteobacteria bacterium]|nr:beta-ketoacyl-[acyl-carrier-protein] synthase family protein [Deltaproteobacteria bacterium]